MRAKPQLVVLVTGSRNWWDSRTIAGALLPLNRARDTHDIILRHGDAAGADRIAAEWARKLGWTVDAHPADWKAYGHGAGFKRNLEMLKAKPKPSIVFAFQLNNSRGTQHMIDQARRKGLLVKVYR